MVITVSTRASTAFQRQRASLSRAMRPVWALVPFRVDSHLLLHLKHDTFSMDFPVHSVIFEIGLWDRWIFRCTSSKLVSGTAQHSTRHFGRTMPITFRAENHRAQGGRIIIQDDARCAVRAAACDAGPPARPMRSQHKHESMIRHVTRHSDTDSRNRGGTKTCCAFVRLVCCDIAIAAGDTLLFPLCCHCFGLLSQ